MTATCPKCGKALKVKDEYAGKRLKCPGCGEAFMASATSAAAPRGVTPTKAKAGAPAAAAAGAASTVPRRVQPSAREQGPKVAINSNVILMLVGVGLVLAFVVVVILGPVRVNRHWGEHQQKAEDDVRDVIEYAMKVQASKNGSWNPNKGRGQPTVGDIRMLPDIFRLSVPQTVRFDGFGSGGQFEGTYNFETGEIDSTLKTGGTMLPSGVFIGADGVSVAGGQRGDKSTVSPLKAAAMTGGTLHVTGRVASAQPSVEIDGKKGEIYYPPEVDEDGNVIAPAKKTK